MVTMSIIERRWVRYQLQDDLFVGAALGVELTPWLGFEAEYSQVKGDVDSSVSKLLVNTSKPNRTVTSMLLLI